MPHATYLNLHGCTKIEVTDHTPNNGNMIKIRICGKDSAGDLTIALFDLPVEETNKLLFLNQLDTLTKGSHISYTPDDNKPPPDDDEISF